MDQKIIIASFISVFVLLPSSLSVPALEYTSVFEWDQSLDTSNLGYRLPNDTIPDHYRLHINTFLSLDDLDPKMYEFDGFVEIYLTATQTTSQIVLHMRDLNIDSVSLTEIDGNGYAKWTKGKIDHLQQMLVIKSSMELVAGKNYTLTLEFRGNVSKSFDGE